MGYASIMAQATSVLKGPDYIFLAPNWKRLVPDKNLGGVATGTNLCGEGGTCRRHESILSLFNSANKREAPYGRDTHSYKPFGNFQHIDRCSAPPPH